MRSSPRPTSLIPHPYGEGVADQWITTHAALRDRGTAFIYAVNGASGRVLEKCGLTLVRRVEREHRGKVEVFCVREISRDAWEQQVRNL